MHRFESRHYQDSRGRSGEYHLFIPGAARHSRQAGERWPLLVYLHGLTEGEGSAIGPLTRARALIEDLDAEAFPFFVLIPRCRAFPATWQAGGEDARRVLELVDKMLADYPLDPDRVSLTGVSMGGFGAWSLAAAHPERWAAIAPVCGGGDPASAARLKDIPCWNFHGAADPIVPVTFSRAMVEAVRAAGGNPRYTEYPRVGHGCWQQAYREKGLFEWIGRQRRKLDPLRADFGAGRGRRTEPPEAAY